MPDWKENGIDATLESRKPDIGMNLSTCCPALSLLFIALLSHAPLTAQPQALQDSLEEVIATFPPNEEKLDAMQNLAGLVWRREPEQAKTLAEEIIALAQELELPIF